MTREAGAGRLKLARDRLRGGCWIAFIIAVMNSILESFAGASGRFVAPMMTAWVILYALAEAVNELIPTPTALDGEQL